MRNERSLRPWLRGFAAAALSASLGLAYGQASGFNFTLGYGPGLVKTPHNDGFTTSAIGLAYQHDFEPRFGIAVDLFYNYDQNQRHATDGIFSAKYFTSDNDATAFYFGSFIGVRSVKATETEYSASYSGGMKQVDHTQLQFPIGLRAGLRGGLDGYFGELFAQAGYAIGSGPLYELEGETYQGRPLYLMVGFSFLGFGWDH